MKTEHGEVVELVWPDGNDDGELYLRGHFEPEEAKRLFLQQSVGLENAAIASLDEELPECRTISQRMEELVARARIEHCYARWSQEYAPGLDYGQSVLRDYNSPGRGRFAVTKVTLWPRPPCALSVTVGDSIYRCWKCGRRFKGPTGPRYPLQGPADCERLKGDESGPFTPVYEELAKDGRT